MRRCFLWLMLLLVFGCQPYLDHELPVYDLTKDFVDFGHKRRLELLSVSGDRESLLLTFNQPLRLLGSEEREPPFTAKLYPRLSLAKTELEGLAGVRLTFAKPAPAAHQFEVMIPAGWRALSGASYLSQTRHKWETPRPELVHLDSALQGRAHGGVLLDPVAPVHLRFNQPISLDSLKSCLRVESLSEGAPGSFSLTATDETLREFELVFEGLAHNADYRLVLDAGVRGVEGSLASSQVLERRVSTSLDLRYLGQLQVTPSPDDELELHFSEPVRPSELERCLWVESGSNVWLETLPEKGALASQKHLLRLTRPRPAEVTLLAGMRAQTGTSLPADVVLRIEPEPEALVPEAPLTPVTLEPGSHVLDAFRSRGNKTATWGLSLRQALAVSALPEALWSDSRKLRFELSKPLFTTPKAKPKPKTPKKPSPNKPNKPAQKPLSLDAFLNPKAKNKHGFYLVRKGKPGQLSRAFLVRSDLEINYSVEPGAVTVVGRSRRLDSPRAGAVAEILSLEGEVLDTTRLDEAGSARFEIAADGGAYAVSLRWGKDRNFVPLQGLQSALSVPSPAFASLDLIHHQPGERVTLFGVLWPQEGLESSQLSYRVVTEAEGAEVHSGEFPTGELGLFETHFLAPESAGRYTVEVEVPMASGRPRTLRRTLRVSQELPDYQKYHFSLLSEKLAPGQMVEGQFDFRGPRHEELELKATLRPSPPPRPVRGWKRSPHKQPKWLDLPVEVDSDQHSFRLQLPENLREDAVLQLELREGSEANLELGEIQRLVSHPGTQLELRVEGATPAVGTNQEIFLKARSPDLRRVLIEGRLLYRGLEATEDTEWTELQAQQFESQDGDEPWHVAFPRAGHYRLDGLVVDEERGISLTQWHTEVGNRDAELQFEVLLDKRRAAPGEQVRARVKGLAAGVPLQVSLSGDKLFWSKTEVLGENKDLEPFTVPRARTELLELFAQALPAPAFGVQRVTALTGLARLQIDPESRTLPLTLELPEEVEAGEPMTVTLRTAEGSSRVRGFLLSRAEHSLFQREHGSLYASLVEDSQEPITRAHIEKELRLEEDQEQDSTFFRGGIRVEGETRLELVAPSQPGRYHWHFMGLDGELRTTFADAEVEVLAASDWEPLTPAAVRETDAFEAGLQVQAGRREAAPIGLTASISEEGDLLPSSYFSTNGLVDPGSVDELVFHYLVPPSGQIKDLNLHWNLGLEGRRHEQWAGVPVIPVPFVGERQAGGRLAPGSRHRLDVDKLSRWALWLRSVDGHPATLEVRHPQGVHAPLTVDKNNPRARVEGRGPGVVELVHGQGASADFVLEDLKPDDGQSRSFGEKLYLMRSLRDSEGADANPARLRKGEVYRGVLHVLNPAPLNQVRFRIPLPGGAVPERVVGERFHPDWRWELGEVNFSVAHLPVGEFTWEIHFRAHSAGDYLWPFTELKDAAGHVLAHSGSGRVVIKAP